MGRRDNDEWDESYNEQAELEKEDAILDAQLDELDRYIELGIEENLKKEEKEMNG